MPWQTMNSYSWHLGGWILLQPTVFLWQFWWIFKFRLLTMNVIDMIILPFLFFYFSSSHWNFHTDISIKLVIVDFMKWSHNCIFSKRLENVQVRLPGYIKEKRKGKINLYSALKFLSWKIKDITIFCLSIHNEIIDCKLLSGAAYSYWYFQ